MVVSTLVRKTAIRDAAEWDARAQRLVERLRPFLERQQGFLDVELARDEQFQLTETTRWSSMEDCVRYVREGSAATTATFSDAMLPTAPYPNGAWTRKTREE